MTSDFLANSLLDHVFGAAEYAPPANINVCLYNVMPSSSGGGTEVAGNSYAPATLTNDLTNFPAAGSRRKANGAPVTFPAPSGSWGSVTGVVLKDADTGDFLISGTFPAPVNPAVDVPLEFPLGVINFNFNL